MLIREGMNPIAVTVGPHHTLREAARRMTAHRVGAAVVLDNEAPGPGIVTERDLLHSNGHDEDPDRELLRDHLAGHLIYAYADWSLEQAAEAMTRGRFRLVIEGSRAPPPRRQVIVLQGGDPVGILSMRDIVRCWLGEGASCELTPQSATA